MDPNVRAEEAKIGGRAGDTIFALASGRPPAAIAIIRISGPHSWTVTEALCGKLGAERQAVLRSIRDPATGELLDRGLVLIFGADQSPTGEAVAELHLHGGRAVVDAVLACLDRQPGLRRAEPGEFTWRAFENGRLDLSEVEGLADLLSAETEQQRRSALAVADGGLSARIAAWRRRLIDTLAQIEAELDFSDEDDVVASTAWPADVQEVRSEMVALIDRPSAEVIRGEVDVVIAGPPNAGKSTLLNALLGRDAAIVSDVPGTTRDVIQARALIKGVSVNLVDTAGLRASDDQVERLGIERARDQMKTAHLILWLGDGLPPSADARTVHIYPRIDVNGREPPSGRLGVSAVTLEGMGALAEMIAASCAVKLPLHDPIALNRRQHEHLARAESELASITTNGDGLIHADHISRAIGSLDRVTGANYVDEMLGSIFERFCIGK